MAREQAVLAYCGGLDTSVILGWLQDEGYDVHAVYVDLGQPCEDRQAILKKAKNCGAKSSRIVDAQEELCRDFAFPVLQWQAKYEGVYLLGTSIARPLISQGLPASGPRSRGRRLRPRRDRQGERPVPLPARGRGPRPGDQDHRPLADRKVPPAFPGRTRDDRLSATQKNIPVKASVAKPYSSDENCLHISYEAGKLEDLTVNGVETGRVRHDRLAAAGARQGRAGHDRASSTGVPVARQRQEAQPAARSSRR